MKIKRSKIKKTLRLLEDARLLIDVNGRGFVTPRQSEDAYDLLLEAEELLTKKEGKPNGKC